MRNTLYILFGTALLVALVLPNSSSAAVSGRFIFEPGTGYEAGDELGIAVQVAADQPVNAFEGVIAFDPAFLELVTVQTARSIIPLWIDLPQNHDLADINRAGRFSFAGVVPGGVTGLRDDEVFFLVFRAKTSGTATLALLEGVFYLNDGTGASQPLARLDSTIEIGASTRSARTIQGADSEPPPPFSVTRARSKDLFDGQWFIIFAARDGETGIDHYEIAECASCSLEHPKDITWHEGASPYQVRDQLLRETVLVKAVDRAGNERIMTLPPERAGVTTRFILALLLLLGVIAALTYARQTRRHKANV